VPRPAGWTGAPLRSLSLVFGDFSRVREAAGTSVRASPGVIQRAQVSAVDARYDPRSYARPPTWASHLDPARSLSRWALLWRKRFAHRADCVFYTITCGAAACRRRPSRRNDLLELLSIPIHHDNESG
jgi:hypothetical protein